MSHFFDTVLLSAKILSCDERKRGKVCERFLVLSRILFLSFSLVISSKSERLFQESVRKWVRGGEWEKRKVWRKLNLSYVYVNAIIRAFLQKVTWGREWENEDGKQRQKKCVSERERENRNVKVWDNLLLLWNSWAKHCVCWTRRQSLKNSVDRLGNAENLCYLMLVH